MFKIYEKDKSKTLQLDLSSSANIAAAKTIVPGTILIDSATGATVAGNGDTLTMANAGLFYISVDYYANTLNRSYPTSEEGGEINQEKGSGKIAAVPITENFEGVMPIKFNTTAKSTLITITDGQLGAAATNGEVAFAMALDTVNWTSGAGLDCAFTTFIPIHVISA